jgi:hypothetical protein
MPGINVCELGNPGKQVINYYNSPRMFEYVSQVMTEIYKYLTWLILFVKRWLKSAKRLPDRISSSFGVQS